MNEVFQHSPKQLDHGRIDVLSNHQIQIKQLDLQSNGMNECGVTTRLGRTDVLSNHGIKIKQLDLQSNGMNGCGVPAFAETTRS